MPVTSTTLERDNAHDAQTLTPLPRRMGWVRLLRRPVFPTLLLSMVLAAFSGPALATENADSADEPIIVLVHGAWANPSGWDETVARLEKHGYVTVTPRLGLLGIESDAGIVEATLDSIPGDKLLVGHSYGGTVISNAAYGRSDVVGLVFTAAFVPDEGESIVSLGEGFAPSEVLHHLEWTGEPFASPAYIERDAFPWVFAADLNPKHAADLNAGQQPASPAILVSESGPAAWHDLPSWYAISGRDLVIDPAQQRWMAQRAGSTIIEFDEASHVGGYTHYVTRLTKLIEQAVQATAG